jgi:phosphoribosylformylglycinamidine cyclo-ligase
VDELLEPTAIYAPLVRSLGREGLLHAAAHVTGGGLVENVPRVLPDGLGAELEPGSWPVPSVFELVAEVSGVDLEELRTTLNLGIGMVLIVAPEAVEATIDRAETLGTKGFTIGRVVRGRGLHGAWPPVPALN